MSIAYSALIKILEIETTLKMTRFMIPIDKRILILKPCLNMGEHYLGIVVHIPVIPELTRLAQVDPPSSRNTWVPVIELLLTEKFLQNQVSSPISIWPLTHYEKIWNTNSTHITHIYTHYHNLTNKNMSDASYFGK